MGGTVSLRWWLLPGTVHLGLRRAEGTSWERSLHGSPPGARSRKESRSARSVSVAASPDPHVPRTFLTTGTAIQEQPAWASRQGGRVWLPSFHLGSFSKPPWRLSRPRPLAVGPRHLTQPVATLWHGIQKFAIPVSVLVGPRGSPAQNSWERQTVRAAVGQAQGPWWGEPRA